MSHEPSDTPIGESQSATIATRLNWLRAGVMGANDGIVSTAGMIFGVAGAAVSGETVVIAAIAAVVAGALSMAVGEYVSVSSQRDSEKAELDIERAQLASNPEYGLEQLTGLVAARGIDRHLAREVAIQLTEGDALAAHARLELGIDPNILANPWHAAFASMLSFTVGGIVPLLAILLAPAAIEVAAAAIAVIAALVVTGSVSARLGRAPAVPALIRTVGGGVLAMTLTYGIGAVVGTQL